MKIVFMGSPEFAMPSLKALNESSNVEVIGVFSQPAKKSGRKMLLTDTPVAHYAKENNIPLYTPTRIGDEEAELLKEINPDLVCVVSYGLILRQAILDVCPFINLHPSSLPRFRGAAPLQYALISGDKDADICIMDVERGVDTGAVYKRVNYNIPETMYLDEYHDRCAIEGAKHLLDVVENWEKYKDNAIPQIEEGMVYANKIDKEKQQIDFTQSVEEVYNLIRGISPVPCAKTKIEGTALKVYKSEIISKEKPSVEPRTVIKSDIQEGLQVACADGIIRLSLIQKAGKCRMADTEVLKGIKIQEGAKFD